jgi:CDP-diacylglycerol--inositol 3-phosphatidyltransferase
MHHVQTYLFAICFGNELFFVALYLMKWVDTPLDYKLAQEHPILMDLTWASAIALVCLPVCVLKNIINLVQLWKASKILVGVDLVERGMARRALEAKEFAASAAANSTALSEKPAMKAI